MRWISRNRWTIWFVVAAVLLGINSIIFYESTQRTLNAQHAVAHSRQVLLNLDGLLATLDDAETGQRGYLLTNNPRYLQPYTNARAAVDDDIQRLRALAATEPGLQRPAAQLGALANAKFAELQQTISLQRAGRHAAALRLVLSDQGLRIMNQMRGTIGGAQAAENRALLQQTAAAQADIEQERITLLFATLGDIALLGLLYVLIRRAFTARERLAEARRQLLLREQDARAKAEDAMRLRDEFLVVAAHELNTPIAALRGSAQLLQRRFMRDGGLDGRNQKMVDLVVGQAGRLAMLIGALLDISRLQAGHLSITRARLDLAALIRRVVQDLETTSERHPLHYQAPDEPVLLEGDALRLEQVAHNLIQNAIKYSPDGGQIDIQVDLEGDRARLTVTDHGLGIPASALPRLFDRFYRADNINYRSISGMGVGLYVVQQIVTQHGGTIDVSSVEGQGSTFIVHLPVKAQQGEHNAPAAETGAA